MSTLTHIATGAVYEYSSLQESGNCILLDGNRAIAGSMSEFTTDTTAKHVSPVEFKLLWTSAERQTIAALKNTDATLADFYEIMDDARLKEVNLSLESTQSAVNYILDKLVAAKVLAEDDKAPRRAEVLSGKFK